MANYFVHGYTPPRGVDSKEKVKQIQATLGVKQDGIWGANTQAAWSKQGFGNIWMPEESATKVEKTTSKDYVVNGFVPPSGVTDKNAVRSIQANLGIKQDGVWGAQTQAAWEKQYGSLWNVAPSGIIKGQKRSAFTPPIDIDNNEAVRQVQHRLGVKPDGVWDKTTQEAWDKMRFAQQPYQPPKGIDSKEEIQQVQHRLGLAPDGVWGKETQKAWDKMCQQSSYDSNYPKTNQQYSIAPFKRNNVKSIERSAEKTMDDILSKQISASELSAFEQEAAEKFVHLLSPQQKGVVASWMKEEGTNKTFSSNMIHRTTQRLIKETVHSPTELLMSKELEEPSPLRPRISDPRLTVPGVTFSNYYYRDKNYFVQIYYNGNNAKELCLGTQLPTDSMISASVVDLQMAAGEQLDWLVKFYLSPGTIIDAALTTLMGENPIMTLPAASQLADMLDPWDHTIRYEYGDILVNIAVPKPFDSWEDAGKYVVKDSLKIGHGRRGR